ncbi:MAG: hypothetical protein WCK65_08925 [Rhodospirillaceae bacterium]
MEPEPVVKPIAKPVAKKKPRPKASPPSPLPPPPLPDESPDENSDETLGPGSAAAAMVQRMQERFSDYGSGPSWGDAGHAGGAGQAGDAGDAIENALSELGRIGVESGLEGDDDLGGEQRKRSFRAIVGGIPYWAGLAVCIAGILAFALIEQDEIIKRWPASARIYQAFGVTVEPLGVGLHLQAVKSEQRVDDGTVILVVEGQVANISEVEREVPLVKVISIGPEHKRVHEWHIKVVPSLLAPGAIGTFHWVERNPGPISEVAVTFEGG